jgi:hypothetical protein
MLEQQEWLQHLKNKPNDALKNSMLAEAQLVEQE